MTDREIVYSGGVPRSLDILMIGQQSMVGLAKLAEAVIGTTQTVSGFALVPTGPASLSAVLSAGIVFQQANLEASPIAGLIADTHTIVKEGRTLDPTTLTFTPPVTVGYAQNFLVEVQYQDVDTGSVVLPYANPSNPAVPYTGPGNAGSANNVVRKGIAAIQVKAGIAATAGSQVPPSPDVGWAGLFVVTVAQGQTTITAGNIAQYSGAPFILATLPQVPFAIQDGRYLLAVTAGTAIAYTGSLVPALPAYVTGMEILAYFGTSNTNTTPTLALNGLAAKPVVKQGSGAVLVGDLTGYIPLIYDGANWRSNGPMRSDITAASAGNVRLYCRTTGSDVTATGATNTDTDAFQTIAAALIYGASRNNLSGRQLIIQLGNQATFAAPGAVGIGGQVVIVGDVANQGLYGIGGTGPGAGGSGLIAATNNTSVTVQGVTVNNTSTINAHLAAVSASSVNFNNVTFSSSVATGQPVAYAPLGGSITVNGGNIMGSNCGSLFTAQGGTIAITANVTVQGTPNFTNACAVTSSSGSIVISGGSFTGAATGLRYLMSLNGTINTSGGGANFFPGSIAGSNGPTGGQYL